jgi:AcrR family transcriptional regulator
LTRAESKARTRTELVEAADRVFRERGYHGASLEAVAHAAGYSTGAVYSTFDGKADLFLAVLDAHLADRIRRIEAAGLEATSAADGARRIAQEYAAQGATQDGWSALVIEFWAHAARDSELRRKFALRHDALKQAIAHVFEELLARTGSSLELPSHEVATVAAALANGLALERLADPEAISDDAFATVAARLMDAVTLGANRKRS